MRVFVLSLLGLLITDLQARGDSLTVVDQVSRLTNPQAASIAQAVAGGGKGMAGYNTAIIVQSGIGNAASIDQINSNNTARILQMGNSNASSIQQFGANGSVLNSQTGNNMSITVTQTGNAPSISITQTRATR